MKKLLILGMAILISGVATNAFAEGKHNRNRDRNHDCYETRCYDQGDRVERKFDRKGDRIEARFDRKAEKAEDNGKYKKARRLRARGDRIDARYDYLGKQYNRHYDRYVQCDNRHHKHNRRHDSRYERRGHQHRHYDRDDVGSVYLGPTGLWFAYNWYD